MKVAIAADKLRHEQEAYTIAHCSFGHSDEAVEWGIRNGVLKGVRKPPGFSCPACVAADPEGATFSRHGAKTGMPRMPPYHEIEIDLWGPMKVDDPNGNEVVFGAICRSTGKFFFQPPRRKSDAESAMRALLAQVRAQSPRIRERFKLTFGGVAIVYSDRGGEFTPPTAPNAKDLAAHEAAGHQPYRAFCKVCAASRAAGSGDIRERGRMGTERTAQW